MWDDQFLTLARHFQVIRYDMRGFGRSALPTDEPYSHVGDLRALLERLDVHDVSLVGLSKGGGVAIDFALTHPEIVRAMVLIDSVLGGFRWSPEASARDGLVWQRALEGGIPAAKESWLAHPLFVPAHRQPAVAARLAQMVDDYSGWHFVNANPERGMEPPAAQRLTELGVPILVIAGEDDTPDFVRVSELLGQRLSKARKIVVPGVGHMANTEPPEPVTAAIPSFFLGQ